MANFVFKGPDGVCYNSSPLPPQHSGAWQGPHGGSSWTLELEFHLIFDVGPRANGQERILAMLLVRRGAFVKAQGQDSWAEGAARGLCGVTDRGRLS